MGETSEPGPWRAFRIAVAYTDAEIDAFHRIAARAAVAPDPPYVGWGVYGTGIAVALIAGRLARETGLSYPENQALVALGVGLVFLIGLWSPSIWRAHAQRKYRESYRNRVLRATRDVSLLFSSNGVCVRRPRTRQFYAWSAFQGVTVDAGLMLFWVPEEIDVVPLLAVPVRLLDPDQQAVIVACCPELSSGSL